MLVYVLVATLAVAYSQCDSYTSQPDCESDSSCVYDTTCQDLTTYCSSFSVEECSANSGGLCYLTEDGLCVPVETTETTDEPSCNEDINQWSVDYTGNSGKFKLYSECNDNLWIQITMNLLMEYDGDGKKTNNKETSFAGQNFAWYTDEDSEYDGYDAIENTYRGTLSVGSSQTAVDFNITTWFFTGDDTFFTGEGEEGIEERSNVIKWTVSLGAWPFEDTDPDRTLALEMNIHVGGNNKVDGNEDTTDDDWRYEFENGFILRSPDTGFLDDVESPVDVEVTSKNTKQTDVVFTFGYYENTLEYDPMVFFDFGSNGSSSSSLSSGSIVAIVCVPIIIILIVLAVYLFWKKKQNGKMRESVASSRTNTKKTKRKTKTRR